MAGETTRTCADAFDELLPDSSAYARYVSPISSGLVLRGVFVDDEHSETRNYLHNRGLAVVSCLDTAIGEIVTEPTITDIYTDTPYMEALQQIAIDEKRGAIPIGSYDDAEQALFDCRFEETIWCTYIPDEAIPNYSLDTPTQ